MRKMSINQLALLGALGCMFLVTRDFPNARILVLSALCVNLTFLMRKKLKNDDRMVRYVEKAHVLRLLFVLVPGLVIVMSVTARMLWAVYQCVLDANLLGTTELEFASRSTRAHQIPSGTYSSLALLFWVSSSFLLIATFAFFLFRSTLTGLRYRFGLLKR